MKFMPYKYEVHAVSMKFMLKSTDDILLTMPITLVQIKQQGLHSGGCVSS